VWETVPSEAERRQRIAAVAGQHPRTWPPDARSGATAEEWWYGGPAGWGLLVETSHLTVAALQARTSALADGDPDPAGLTFGDALVNGGVPLVHPEAHARWRAELVPYPPRLAAAVVRRHGQIDHFWRWRMSVERGNPLRLHAHFAEVAERILQIAAALSGVWWSGSKWQMQAAAQLPVAPPNLAGRLARVSAAPAPEEALVDETYDLVDTHLPDVDVARLRAIFHFSRQPW
jgi:hypothetical protein